MLVRRTEKPFSPTVTFELHHDEAAILESYCRIAARHYKHLADEASSNVDREVKWKQRSIEAAQMADTIARRTDPNFERAKAKAEPEDSAS